MNFLPNDFKYTEPTPPSKYFQKIPEGETTIRILDKAQLGWQGWKDAYKEDSTKISSPVRIKDNKADSFPMDQFDEEIRDVKFIWAMPIYNFSEKCIQVWAIPQASIRQAIMSLNRKEKWGDPVNYNIVIERTGKDMATKYTVSPEPKEELEAFINAEYLVWRDNFDWDKWWASEEPFKKAEDIVDVDKISKEI